MRGSEATLPKKTALRQLLAEGGSVLGLSSLSGFPISMAAVNRFADPGDPGDQIASIVLQNLPQCRREKQGLQCIQAAPLACIINDTGQRVRRTEFGFQIGPNSGRSAVVVRDKPAAKLGVF